MTLQTLLATLAASGIQLRGEGDELVVTGNEKALDAELVRELRAHKATLRDFVREHGEWWAPRLITPEMLPLVSLSQAEIDAIVAGVEGGARNVQDIYPLAPLQEGILFHHLLKPDGDPYLLPSLHGFERREQLDAYLAALQAVVDRHDILRTGVVWEGLPEPVQVVWRRARLEVEEVELEPGEGGAAEALWARFDARSTRLDVRRAPVMRACVARDEAEGRWLLLLLRHHLISDHTTLEVMGEEIRAHLQGREAELPAPLPFRNFVAQARLGATPAEHEAFFRGLLADVREPTAPFGLLDVWSDGTETETAQRWLEPALDGRLRSRARALGVSLASVCHVAWGLVLERVTGRGDVVFGTLLFGRMQGGEGADRAMGLFMNTLPVRVRVGAEGAEASVRGMHRQLAELLRHEHASLALAQRCSGVEAPAPLFTSTLNYRHNPGAKQARAAEESASWGGMRRLRVTERTNYPVGLAVTDLGDEMVLTGQAPGSVGAERVCALMHRALEALAEALESAPERPVGTLDVLPESERRRVVEEWNRTDAEYPADACVHELFEAQAERVPGAVAAVFEDDSLTYAQLNARANRLAHHLRARGVEPGARVAVCVERSLEMAVGLLAVMKAGGAYVPLDPGYPAERLRHMLDDSRPVLLLTQAALRERFAAPGIPVVALDADAAAWAPRPETNPPRAGLTPEHPAYVIYTSGSTGEPKGVVSRHRAVANFLAWGQEQWRLEPGEATLQVLSFSFEVSVREIFGPLAAGARVVFARPGGQRDPAYLLEAIRRHAVSVLVFPPSQIQAFLQEPALERCTSLRWLVTGGDSLAPELVRELFRRLPGIRFHHEYGPTETTVASTVQEYGADAGGSGTSIGRPVSNTRVYLLDGRGRPAPVGVAGEIHVGGAGVARGYLDRPSPTAARFVPDPFGGEPGARMYRTGDLGRWRADGTIEFLGRDDFQVKIRGFRVELGEIEARLREHEGVREAVVAAREHGAGDPRLVAYCLSDAALDVEALRRHVGERLPDYMVPAAYVRLESFPLTPSGKVDRKALPAPEDDAYARRGYEAPVGETEAALAEIWSELLGMKRVGRWDNFFELGGHSLLIVKLAERMRRRGLHADVGTLFTTPVLAELAEAVGGETSEAAVPANAIPAGATAITPEMLPLVALSRADVDRIVAGVKGGAGNVQDIYPLAPLQEGILFHHLLAREGDPYLASSLYGFDRREQLDAYVAALQAVIDRHDILRTSVAWEGLPEPVQVVWRRARLRVEEVELDPADGDARKALWARFDPRRTRIDLRRAPLMRAAMAHDPAEGRWLLLVQEHHLIGDHTTLEVLREEIRAHQQGRQAELTAPVPFRNFVAQARLGVSPAEHEAFFRALLGDVDEPTAPFGVLDVWSDGTGVDAAKRKLEPELAARLRARARALGVSAASLCHVAWGQVLARVTGRDDVVFGTVLFGRMRGGEGADRAMGIFMNMLPVRVRVGAPGAEESVRGMHRQLAELLRHEHASLALAQRSSGVEAPAPLFTSFLNYRHNAATTQVRSLKAEEVSGGMHRLQVEDRSNYPVALSVNDSEDGLELSAQAPGSVGAARVCALMQRALEALAEALESAPERGVGTLDVLPEAERRRVVEEWNRTEAEYPAGSCVHELFEAHVARAPGATAVVHEGEALTYAELNARANRLAHHLRALGVGPEARVAICVERSPEMVAAVLGVLKAGGAYVPLDPGYPAERLRHMLSDSAPRVVLTHTSVAAAHEGLFAGLDAEVLALDAPVWEARAETNPGRGELGPDHAAYVIYTSGSTGRPKGVMVAHRNVAGLVAAQGLTLGVDAESRVLQFASFSFDASVFEMVMALCQGASLHVPQGVELLAGDALERVVARGRITHVTLPPAVLPTLSPDALASVRTMVLAGEALPEAAVKRWAGGRRLLNAYGPTETAVWATFHECRAGEDGNPPIGRPIPNARVYILDEAGEPVPAAVAGELYIGGAGVARGYLGRPELTAERFVADRFGGGPGARLYRTGDLGRWRADGTIEFLGRNDFQVKIRGFRVELGEIEARLADHPAVREAVVVARADGADGPQLVAYWVGEEVGAEALRAHVGERLPEYMVPAAYVRLEALPLTPSGKLDRKALPSPEGDAYARRGYEAPVGETEQALAEIWGEVLGLERVGRWDDFFELGGHSILTVLVVSRIQQVLGVEITPGDVFDRPVLRELAEVLAVAGRAELPPIERVDRIGRLPLSYAQQRLWFLEQMGDLGIAYHVPQRLRLLGALDRDALARALDRLVARHEGLRTTFPATAGEPEQRIAPETTGFPLVEHDLAGAAPGELERVMDGEVVAPFDLVRGPLIRGRLLRLADDDHVLLLTMHHIVADGWSMGVLIDELSVLYAAFRAGRPDPLPPLPVQYADYAAWQRRWVEDQVLEAQASYWTRTLAGAPGVLDLPTDHPRPQRQDHAGAYVSVRFEQPLTAGLKELGRRHGTTLFMTLLAGWAVVLSRLSGQRDVVIGTGTANRGRAEIERLIGFFVNTLAVRVDLSDAPTVAGLLERVKARALEAQQNQDIPFEQVVDLVQPTRSRGHSPLFQVSFVWQNAPRGNLELPGLELGKVPGAERTTAKFDQSLSMWEADGWIGGGVEYATSLFERETVERYAGYLRRVLEQMVADDGLSVERLALLPEAERRLVVEEWNRTEAPYPGDACIHELFEAQARRSPEAVAVAGGEVLTYAELNARANRLAHYLRDRGVGSEARVGLCVERGPGMVVGVLAVLKAGGAYVPLDPAYPDDRLRFMVADSAPALLLAQASLAGRLGGLGLPVVALDADAPAWSGHPATDPGRAGLTPGHLAYVIYTSGSTGRPKGVMVAHRNVANLVAAQARTLGVEPDSRVLQFASFSFDASVFEMVMALCRGASLHLAPGADLLAGEALERVVAEGRITHVTLPPAVLPTLPEGASLETVSTMVLAGEALPAAAVRRWAGGRTLINAYGPTEAAVWTTFHPCHPDEGGDPPIGRPIINARVYLLDAAGEPVPAAGRGELHIGGAGVARGYLGRPALTAQRFVPDPFGGEPGARLYRTGDLGRWRTDGTMEFLGRNDFQVKVRGFRIELGEIEARLREHPGVREAAVVGRDESSGEQRIVAYVVPEWERVAGEGGTGGDWDGEYQDTWLEVFDHQYGELPAEGDVGSDTGGWMSSYTGQALPADEMGEWIAATVERIRSLSPQRVLEIGCGSGLLLSRVAPGVERYVGADFSLPAIRAVEQMRGETPELRHVELLHRVADDFGGLEPGSFDTVVINSVVQYLPSMEYLVRVIEGAVRLVRPGGHVFVGDVRDLRLLSAFHAAVVTYRSPAGRSVREWKDEVEHSLAREEELVIDPAFFWSLGSEIEGIAHAETLQKRGRYLNELTQFRYDVVLRTGPDDLAGAAEAPGVDWEADGLTLEGVRARIAREAGDAVVVRGIPNARVSRALGQLRTAQELDAADTVDDLLRAAGAGGVDPEELWSLGEALGWRVEVGLSEGDPGRVDAAFRRDAGSGARRPFPLRARERRLPLAAYGTDPLKGKRMAALVRALRAHAGASLPEYMVPSAYVHLDALPLTPNGKLDRKALPAPEGDAYARRGYEAPAGETEQALAEIWSEVLGVERVGRRDHFFELGGHSLLAVQVVSRIRQGLAAAVEVGVVFERPVLKELAEAVAAAGRAELPPIERAGRSAPLPLSYAQQRLWFLEQLGNLGRTYHMPFGLRLLGALDRAALVRALDRLVARHESLRTTFVVEGGEPGQRIAPETSRFPLVEHDLAGGAGAVEEALELVMSDEAGAPFDLERGPLIRGRLVRLAEDDHVLLLTMHHIVSDGWSMGVLADELSRLYGAFRAGRSDPLPALPVQYADYAAWQRRWVRDQVLEAQASYWAGALAGVPQRLELPTDHPRPQRQDHAGAHVEVVLDEALTAGLKALGRRHGTTLFMTVLAGWAAVLGRLAGQDEVVIGTPTANRGRREIEGLIGFFVNTLALRVDLSDRPTVAGLLDRVRTRALEAQQNQDIPFEQVVELVEPVRSLAHTPLFQVLFSWQNAGRISFGLPGLELGPLPGAERTTAKFDLSLALGESDGRISGGLTYATALYERATVERYVGYLHLALQRMAADDAQAVDRLSLLPEAERRQVVEEWNADRFEVPRDACAHELFEAQVERTPDAVAVVFEEDALSYAELNRRANRLAHRLRALGVGPDARVGLCVERGVEMVVGVLGVLKAGGAWVPLDPAYPAERLRYLLHDSGAAVVLARGAPAGVLARVDVPVLELGEGGADAASWPEANPERAGLAPSHLAYVLYTSGSTGEPKGVMVAHRGVVNLVHWMGVRWPMDAGHALLQKTPLSFDVSVWELMWPLASGARLVVARPEGHRDPEYLAGVVRRERVTAIAFVPSMLDVFLAHPGVEGCATLRWVMSGGEALSRTLVRRLREQLPAAELYNRYAPTEATVNVVAWRCEADEAGASIPIGRPRANVPIYILDGAGEPVPVGVTGELHIGGVQVARGYQGRPELTAERFVADPFGGEPGARLYRTGDLARWRRDGAVELVGRNDFQVKLRGLRVELGEIEARLREHPAVREGAVLAREDAPGDRRLAAYYVADEPVDVEALRSHLSERLPEYMVPAAYVRLEALPLTGNGKLDRKALPAPEADAYAQRGYEAPVGETERALAEIWEEVLGVERVGRRDDFFELGGHSLLIVKLIERMRRRGLHAEVGTLFTTPVLAELAEVVSGRALDVAVPPNAIPADAGAVTPEMLPLVALSQGEIDAIVAGVEGGARNVQDIYPLAPLQEGILFHHLLSREGDPYLLPALYGFERREQLDAYLAALQAVVDRHDILRTSVVWEGLPEPVQVVWRRARLAVEEVVLDAAEGDATGALWTRLDPWRTRLDLRRAPLIRAAVARDAAEGRWLLLLQRHHIVSDHTSLDVMQEEIRAHLQGREAELPHPLPFRNYVAQARLGVGPAEHEAFFRALLGDVEEPTAPFGLLDARSDGSGVEVARRRVEPALEARLRSRARALGVSAASVCHLAWGQVLARVTGRGDVVFGTVLFGRMQGGEGADRTLGLFMNTLPVRVRVDEREAEAGVRGMHRQLAELLRHEHASLALAQRCSGVEAPAPLFTSILNYRHQTAPGGARAEARGGAGPMRPIRAEVGTNYPLELSVDDYGEALGLTAHVPASVGAERVCALMHRALEALVEALETAPRRAVATLDVLPEAERRRVVEEWNRTEAGFPRESCLHELFEAQAERTPGAAAVVFGDRALTYAELNGRANRLAHHLQALGVRPDARVGICVERGLEMMVGLLAVLKAGGAYVPLDPAYPAERLRYMIEDSAPRVVLTKTSIAAAADGPLAGADAELLPLDAPTWDDRPATNPERGSLSPAHLAYVTYTSGSTGRPKGVMVAHRGVVNLVHWYTRELGISPRDSVLVATSYAFDLTQRNLFGPLVSGGQLHLAREPFDPRGILAQIRERGITLTNLTSTAFHALIDAGAGGDLAGMRLVVLGGEAARPEKLMELGSPRPAFVNAYGPTECSGVVTHHRLADDLSSYAGRSVPLGQPIANSRIYVLDGAGEPAPVGVVGEIFVGGAQVSRGYLNRPELTAERFVADPFGGEPGARLYRTGDLGRWRHDGSIEFAGRDDFQVKVRGFRVELGEVEARLREHPAVREAVVVAREDRPGDQRLVAYWVGAEEAAGAEALRRHVGERLPEYMVPAAYIHLEALPLTPSAKLDRRALPSPEGDAFARRAYEAPEGEVEEALAEIWSEVLGVERVGRWDHFFELGGHSLLIVRVVSRIRQLLGVEVELGTVFERPVLASLAEGILDAQLAQFDPEELAGLVSSLGELGFDASTAFDDPAGDDDLEMTAAASGPRADL